MKILPALYIKKYSGLTGEYWLRAPWYWYPVLFVMYVVTGGRKGSVR